MKKRYKFIFLILIVFVILFIILFSRLKFKFLQDDILFIKFLGNFFTSEENIDNTVEAEKLENVREEEDVIPKYIFDITYKYMNFTNINLVDTINSKMLVNEKIAPGISGKFDIVLKTNKTSEYQIYFESKNEKPKNLFFNISNTDIHVSSIEELSQYLRGSLKKGDTKTITIEWSWKYENELQGNIQDTEDSKNISEYVFNIYTYGEEELY